MRAGKALLLHLFHLSVAHIGKLKTQIKITFDYKQRWCLPLHNSKVRKMPILSCFSLLSNQSLIYIYSPIKVCELHLCRVQYYIYRLTHLNGCQTHCHSWIKNLCQGRSPHLCPLENNCVSVMVPFTYSMHKIYVLCEMGLISSSESKCMCAVDFWASGQ